MTFADTQVRPGRETALRVSASDTSSLCSVAVVDKSIELMGATSQLTKAKVRLPRTLAYVVDFLLVLIEVFFARCYG